MSKNIFTKNEKDQIKEAVAFLEKESSGELVLYYAKDSDNYVNASWKFSGIIGIVLASAFVVLAYMWILPSYFTPIVIAATILVAMIISYAIARFSLFFRFTVTDDQAVNHRVLTKARDMFLQEQVFSTVDRTGILIYISALEHKVIVLGDSGINKKIDSTDWEHIVTLIIKGIKSKQMTNGIVNAIDACKKLLLENGFVIKPGDTNELHDAIRIEE